jgi:hypothetical protein
MIIKNGLFFTKLLLNGSSPRLSFSNSSSVVLVPGAGFEPTFGDSVGTVGSPGDDGYDAKVISRWDMVPFQTYNSGQVNIGLMAFHMNGIDRVEFYLDGGPATTVTNVSENSDSGLPDYWATINVDALDDGEHDLRAIVYPSSAGEPRVMDPWIFNTNANGSLPAIVLYVAPDGDDTSGTGTSLNPYQTFFKAISSVTASDRNGLTIKAKAGTYSWNSGQINKDTTSKRWITVEADDGLVAGDVVVDSYADPNNPYGLRTERVRVRKITFDGMVPRNPVNVDGEATFLWFDECVLNGPGGDTLETANIQDWNTFVPTVYATDSSITRWKNGFANSDGSTCKFAKNCSVNEIYADAYTGNSFVANCTSSNLLYFASLGTHPDIYQSIGASDEAGSDRNAIVYNLKAINTPSAQGIFIANGNYSSNMAFVNIHITDSDIYSQFAVPNMNHFLIRGCTLPEMEFRQTVSSASNFQFYGNVHELMREEGASGEGDAVIAQSGWFDQNHFRTGTSWGTNATTGDPANLFADPSSGNFSPGIDSPLLDRLSTPIYFEDVNGIRREAPDTVGAYYQ